MSRILVGFTCLGFVHDLITLPDIRVVPNTRVKQGTFPDPRFLRDCISALEVSDFLGSFTCTVGSVLPPLLPLIQSKPCLHTLRIEARLTREQTELLCQFRRLHSLTLENASSAVMDALPKWAESLRSTLEHLTIHVSRLHAASPYSFHRPIDTPLRILLSLIAIAPISLTCHSADRKVVNGC
jgi:hypothetical protein